MLGYSRARTCARRLVPTASLIELPTHITRTTTPNHLTRPLSSHLYRTHPTKTIDILRDDGVPLQHQYAHRKHLSTHTGRILIYILDGGACVAMVGKDCVAIACDLRLGMQALTVSNNFPKIFPYGSNSSTSTPVYLGLTGLATDVSTVSELFRYKVNMYRLREERDISPKTFSNLVSSSLYERRFGPWFVSPVVAGIDGRTGEPFICGLVHSSWMRCIHLRHGALLLILVQVRLHRLHRLRKRLHRIRHSIGPALRYV